MAGKEEGYVALSLPLHQDTSTTTRPQSCWRVSLEASPHLTTVLQQWKRLSRFQRSLLYMFLLVCLVIYLAMSSHHRPSLTSSTPQVTILSSILLSHLPSSSPSPHHSPYQSPSSPSTPPCRATA